VLSIENGNGGHHNQQVKQTVTSDSAMASPKVTDTKDSNELELELSEADVL